MSFIKKVNKFPFFTFLNPKSLRISFIISSNKNKFFFLRFQDLLHFLEIDPTYLQL